MSDEATYEELALIVKERDGWQLRGPVDNNGHHKLLKDVRRDPWEPDSVDNMETICMPIILINGKQTRGLTELKSPLIVDECGVVGHFADAKGKPLCRTNTNDIYTPTMEFTVSMKLCTECAMMSIVAQYGHEPTRSRNDLA